MWKQLLLAFVVIAGGSGGNHPYTGPRCLGPYCVDRIVLLGTLFKQLGPPAAKSSPFCYRSPDGNVFLALASRTDDSRITGEVQLSDFCSCRNRPVALTQEDLKTWKTKEGIGLGTSEGDVLKAYGKPTSRRTFGTLEDDFMLVIWGYHFSRNKRPDIGDTEFIYSTPEDLQAARFGFRRGRVCWLVVRYDE
jgi:hypothetical protein